MKSLPVIGAPCFIIGALMMAVYPIGGSQLESASSILEFVTLSAWCLRELGPEEDRTIK